MNPTNIIYFGSPQFSAKILDSLLKNTDKHTHISAVVTTQDTPQGRKQIITETPVAQLAKKHHLPTFKPRKLDTSNLSHLKLLKPDIFLVVAYGKIIPPNWLYTPKIATLNIHFSLLPKYRGALCVSEAIKNQDAQTGVTLMEMDEKLDHGPIIAQKTQNIDLDDNLDTLTHKLATKATTLLKDILPLYIQFKQTQQKPSKHPQHNLYLPPQPQHHASATYTPSYKTHTHSSAYIPYSQLKNALAGSDALKTNALIRSLNPEPGVWTTIKSKKIKILQTSLTPNQHLKIDTIQIPGKQPISWKQFINSNPLL